MYGTQTLQFLENEHNYKIQNNKLNMFESYYHLPVVSTITDQMTFFQIWFSHHSQQKPTTLLISDTVNKANLSILAVFKIHFKKIRKISCVVPNTDFNKLQKRKINLYILFTMNLKSKSYKNNLNRRPSYNTSFKASYIF